MRSPGVTTRTELFFIGILFSNKQYNDRMSAKKSVNLEKALADLENIVEELESGDLPLEKAMKKFEEGVKLTRNCQSALKEAEQKVEILLESAGGEDLEEFDVEDED
jgi:exodeoxyribonuclease VII small subunit